MNAVSLANSSLCFASIALQTAVAVLLVRRGYRRELPWLVALVVFGAVRDTALFVTYRLTAPRYLPYFILYWSTAAIFTLIRIGVVANVLFAVTREYQEVFALTKRAFMGAVAVIGAIALGAGIMQPGSDVGRVVAAILMWSRGLLVLEAGLLIAMFVFSAHLGLSWKSVVLGAGLGLSLCATLQLATLAAYMHFGKEVATGVALANAAAYVLANLVWLGYCLPKAPIAVAHEDVLADEMFRASVQVSEML